MSVSVCVSVYLGVRVCLPASLSLVRFMLKLLLRKINKNSSLHTGTVGHFVEQITTVLYYPCIPLFGAQLLQFAPLCSSCC